MENQQEDIKEDIKENIKEKAKEDYLNENYQHHTPAGRIMGGFVIIAVGSILLANQLGVIIPGWVFTWQMLLIAIGLFIGALHSFRGGGWLFPVGIGAFMLIDKFYPGVEIRNYIIPAVIIFIGLLMIFNSRRRTYWRNKNWNHNYQRQMRRNKNWQKHSHGNWDAPGSAGGFHYSAPPSEDYIDSVSVFGGVRKNIVSKNFKGGDVVSVFGGSEINLSNADISGRVVLEVTQVFGGTRLIVPPHWQIDPAEVIAFLGSIEDKRILNKDMPTDPNKVLVLKGSSVFGGLEITNY